MSIIPIPIDSLLFENISLFIIFFFKFLHENENSNSWPIKNMNNKELAIFISSNLVNMKNKTNIIIDFSMAPIVIFAVKNGVKKLVLFLLSGVLSIRSFEDFSKASIIAGMESVTRLIHSNCRVENISILNSIDTNTSITSIMFPARRYSITFFMFDVILLPSSTPSTIVEKLSSTNMQSATFFTTSVPVMPIPIPMSAF